MSVPRVFRSVVMTSPFGFGGPPTSHSGGPQALRPRLTTGWPFSSVYLEPVGEGTDNPPWWREWDVTQPTM
jgi:hypothetical protein